MSDVRLTPSQINAALAISRYIRHNGHATTYREAAIALKSVSAHFASLDYNAAIVLSKHVSDLYQSGDFKDAVRRSVLALSDIPGSPWSRLVLYGVDVIVQGLDDDVDSIQCLADADLLLDTEETYAFWDNLRERARTKLNLRKNEIGRRGEELSFQHETRQLAMLNIDREAIWISRRDDTRGFDILSYRLDGIAERQHFVEVKAHNGSCEFYLSRREWVTAVLHREHYEIQLWDLQHDSLSTITVDSLIKLMPLDTDKSVTWETIKVRWGKQPEVMRLDIDARQLAL